MRSRHWKDCPTFISRDLGIQSEHNPDLEAGLMTVDEVGLEDEIQSAPPNGQEPSFHLMSPEVRTSPLTFVNHIFDNANQWLNDLVSYIPGKPIEDVARELGLDPTQIVKLASNQNPLGPSPLAVKAMREALEKAHFYPDGGGYHLRAGIAEKFGLSIENVILGNGSNEIIEFLGHAFLQPGDNIVTAQHAFVVYKILAKLFGAEAVEVPDPNLTHDLPAMADAINDRTKIVYIANPNNPTGTMVSERELDRFIDRVPKNVVVAL